MAGIVRVVADKFNWFLVRVPLIITGPLGKKKRAMIFARFSTPGTFPRKLRGEFRAPFSAAGRSRFSALYLNARRISRAGGNALLKSAIFYPIFFLSLFLHYRPPATGPSFLSSRSPFLALPLLSGMRPRRNFSAPSPIVLEKRKGESLCGRRTQGERERERAQWQEKRIGAWTKNFSGQERS